jgi:7,8-dihydropterin-6-yl-methyl-4-(beta-D-ribofuranosyl)aminobenzene 5'-phosphate synthase
MRLTVLNDNMSIYHAMPDKSIRLCGSEHGVSYLIEDEVRMLFDTGPSDIILRNAKILGIDLNQIPLIVLSHGHWDHGNGLAHLSGKRLITHPDSFCRRYRKKNDGYSGLPLSLDEAKKNLM